MIGILSVPSIAEYKMEKYLDDPKNEKKYLVLMRPGNAKYTKIYLSDDASNKTLQSCSSEGIITHGNYATAHESLNQMISIALAAYMGGKKGIHATDDITCEITFFVIQETYF